MMGRNHVFCEAAIIVTTVDVLEFLELRLGPNFSLILVPEHLSFDFSNGILNNFWVFFVIAGFFVWFGSLLPDIDSKTSLLGRYIHFPGKHRTWTHSIWFCILLLLLCFLNPVFRYLFFSYVLHIWIDSVSASGICFLYPLVKYIEYDSGAFIAPHHKVKLYYAGKKSEAVVVTVIVVICFVICLFARLGFVYLWIKV